MQGKIYIIFIFLLALLLAASVTLNVLQLKEGANPELQKARANLNIAFKDLKKTGTLLENNVSGGYIVLSYETKEKAGSSLKAWVVPGTTLQRIHIQKTEGVVASVFVETIEQENLTVGEEIYIVTQNSIQNNRFELQAILVGELLPLSK